MELPTIIECQDIPNDRSEISTPNIAKQYEHLKNISDKIPDLNSNADILLLVGRDLIEAHHVQEQIVGPRNSPFAQRLNLGWVIVGEVCLNQTHRPTVVNVNKTHILPNGRNTIQEPCQNSLQLKEHQLQEFLNSKLTPQDHIGESIFIRTKNDEKIGTSREDKQFLQIMDKEFYQNSKGNWTAPLPFKTSKPNLPNNRPLALHRANLLHTSLKKNSVKRQHFVTFMEKVLDSGAAEEAPPLTQKDCWYLPIFGVYHPKKPDQIRGVFDSSALYEGTSLNNVLLTGPDLINNLLGVLLRFRKDEYAVTADIEQMFYSFFVTEDHRDYLRFFWYQDNNPDRDLVEYRMRVQVFGNSPSPAVATYGLRRAVENADPDIKDFVNNNFYVDDALTSLPTSQQAADLIQRTQKTLKENGNIRLHKIASNSEIVLNTFKPEDLSKDLKSLELGQDVLPTQRSLGLAWNLQLDTFTFNIELEDKPYTRRGVLSIVNSLFDPMGFIAPVIIHGKHLLREMIAHGTDWDQPLLPDHEVEWIEWKNSLQCLADLTIPRMYLNTSVSTADNIELHLYSDASEKAISAVAYIRTVNNDGTIGIGFVMGKSRLSPQLGHTIPRLELCAAVMAVEIAETIHDNLDINVSSTKFYTDSKVVLGYINNLSRRFYTYVSNRVDRILQSTTPQQWNYVCTSKNPADQGSRCLSTTSIKDSMWLLGPPQLHCRDDCIPLEACHTLVNPELDKEIRPEVRVTKTNIVDNFSNRFHKFSSWTRLVNAISYLKRVAQCRKSKNDIQPRSIESYREAENHIIRLVQESFYSEEIQCLKDNKPIPRNSNLRQLDPILDGDSVLRIGGRLNKSNLSKELKNPVIVHGKSYIASLLVTHYHQQVQHQGRHFTEGNIRSNGYWITGAKRLISTILHQCFKCRKFRGTLEYQKMADLPVDRLTPGPPFTSVGVDTFGPWTIVTRRTRGGAANSKRWAILFSCLTTRAIHIEVVEELSSSAFINSLRRFIALRGDVKEFRSDRGTNFVGATNDLRIDTINVEDNPVKDFLFNNGTVWIFNAPHSSHMGGAWERMIGVTRKILDSMLIDSKYLTHDVLSTLMAEVCAIVNARPISTISSDPESPEILSPALLITQKAGIKPVTTDNFSLTNIYRSQWKQVQMLSDIFWKHWKGDYLHSLQQRRKWNDDRPNIKTGDVILLKDKEVHRNEWPLGVVTNVIPSDDGKIRKVEVRITKDGKPTKYTRPINEVVILIN